MRKSYSTKYVEFAKYDKLPQEGELLVFVEKGEYGNTIHAVDFLCPCGCGLNLYTPVVQVGETPRHNKCWTYSESQDKITLEPSIQVMGGCNSHFFIRDNEVV